jgi:hypothetical protein
LYATEKALQNFYLNMGHLLRHLRGRFFQLALLCFLCVAKSYGQTGNRSYGTVNVEITKEKRPKKIYTKVELTGAYTGGDTSLIQTLEKNLNQSILVKKRAKAGKYHVSVRYLLERDGSVTDINCISNPGFEMCEQVVAVIKRIFPRGWHPAEVRPLHTSTTSYDE